MADLAEQFERRRNQLVDDLARLAREDVRIAACWLQGSLAEGTADALSDVDAYLAIDDDAFEEFYAQRLTFISRLGAILTGTDGNIPNAKAYHCVLDGPVKLDLFFESLSKAPAVNRPAFRMLVDKGELEPRLKTGWRQPLSTAAMRVAVMFGGTRQGCTWPVRLLLRGQWSEFAMAEVEVIDDNLATLLAVQQDPALFAHNRFSYPRLLTGERRSLIESLMTALIDGLSRRDLVALQAVVLRIDDAFVREGRAAFAALGMPYPGTEEGDAAIHDFYLNQWPVEVPT